MTDNLDISHQKKIEALFGAQNISGISQRGALSMPQQVDPSKMSERERRIFLREQERKNRSAAMHGAGSQDNAYGTPM